MTVKNTYNRRRVLRGTLAGAAMSVGLPYLDCFLNDNGTALADDTPLPLCFGVWFFGLGFTPGRWEPKVTGSGYKMAPECEALTPFKDHINIYSGLKCFLDGSPNQVHVSGPQVILGGSIPRSRTDAPASIDSIIADQIGRRTRFQSIEMSCVGVPLSYSKRAQAAASPAEISPAALYKRIFGPEFIDPNADSFTPDSFTMARYSALSAVSEERKALVKGLGAGDRIRLDQYFTSLRTLEKQLELALQKPVPLKACTVPAEAQQQTPGNIIEDVLFNHKLFAGLAAHALACGQTQVVNVLFSQAVSNIRNKGSADTHHILTHEEHIDEKLGYPPKVEWFNQKSAQGFADFLGALQGIREGAGTLLDRSLIFGTTDVGRANIHAVNNVPLFTAGKAGGRIKTGLHVHLEEEPVTRVGLTVQQIMGVPVGVWGAESNRTSKPISEIMA